MTNKIKPIIFNSEMVKAILEGRKTQTRRVVNKEYLGLADIDGNNIYIEDENGNHFNILETNWTRYKVGDLLYVREPAKVVSPPVETCKKLTFKYLADNKTTEIFLDDDFDYSKKWIQRCQGVPNGCLKEMARIFLKVTNVRVERLQDITRKDVLKEGIKKGLLDMYKHYEILGNGFSDKDYELNSKFVNGAICSFRTLWNSTSKDGYKWEDDPFVFVYEFERAKYEFKRIEL